MIDQEQNFKQNSESSITNTLLPTSFSLILSFVRYVKVVILIFQMGEQDHAIERQTLDQNSVIFTSFISFFTMPS